MNKGLVKKSLIVGLIGFSLGVLVGIAFLMISPGSGEMSALRIGIHIILSGMLGAIALGSSVVYEVENWSVTRCTVTHFAITFTTYFSIGFSLGWLPLGEISTYIMVGCMVVAYFMIWISMYLVSKKQAKELDEELKKWKNDRRQDGVGNTDEHD